MVKRLLFFLLISFCLSSCSEEELLTDYEQSVINYFLEVGIGDESGMLPERTFKWTVPMKIFINNKENDELYMELIRNTIDEINVLVTDGFSIEIVSDSILSNTYIFLGSPTDFDNKFPNLERSSDVGVAFTWHNNNINIRAVIFINAILYSDFNEAAKNTLLKQELMHSLGFLNHSFLYRESALYRGHIFHNFKGEFAQIDKDVIRLLYHPSMSFGLDATQVEEVLRNIYLTD